MCSELKPVSVTQCLLQHSNPGQRPPRICILHTRSFKIIRIRDKPRETETSNLFAERFDLIQKSKRDQNNDNIKEDIEDIEAKISEIVAKENIDKIKQTFSKLSQAEGCSISQGIWSLKKKNFPKVSASVPAAKKDINNRLISDPAGLKQLYLETFTHRLRERPAKECYSELSDLQESLLRKRLAISRFRKSAPWTEKDVITVMKSLKANKSKDPHGMINELFKFPNAGADLIKSITVLMNRIKEQCYDPDMVRFKIVSAIYKNCGSKLDLDNDRGIMTTTILNSILQKLIYKDIYPR